MKTRYKIIIAIAWSFAQVIAPSLTGCEEDGTIKCSGWTRSWGGSALMAQDAFYIYRNDGDFNGFFFDQVVSMSFSKIDPQGVEHEEYVIQEIETADSLYRIPLCAIDSIGFQQPEIRFSKKLKDIDASGLMDYYQGIQARSKQLFFEGENGIPAQLIPQVGDVLISYDERIEIEDVARAIGLEEVADQTSSLFHSKGFFLGKVTDVRQVENFIVVTYDYVREIGDIFEQFITVEQVGYSPDGNVKRRVAGFNPDGTLRKAPKSLDYTLFSFSGRLQKEWKPFPDISVTIGVDVGMEANLFATYAISGVFDQRLFVKLVFSEKFSAGLSMAAAVILDDEATLPSPLSALPAIRFPAIFPIFQVNPIPEGFFRFHGQIEGKLTVPPINIKLFQTVTLDTEDPWLLSFKWGNPYKEEKKANTIDWGDAGKSLTFYGYLQGGVKQTTGLSTNDWIAKLVHASVGLEIHSGPKFSASLNGTDGGYIEFASSSIDRDLKYKWKLGSKEEERTLWSDTKTSDAFRVYAHPQFKKTTDVKYDEQTQTVTATVYPTAPVFMSSEVGTVLFLDYYESNDYYNKKKLFSYGTHYSPTDNPDSYTGTYKVDTLWAGSYSVCAAVKVDTTNFCSGSEDDPVWFEIPYKETNNAPDTLFIGHEGGTRAYKAKSNSLAYWLKPENGLYYENDNPDSFHTNNYEYWLTRDWKRITAEAGEAEYDVTFTARSNPTNKPRYQVFSTLAGNAVVIYQRPKP